MEELEKNETSTQAEENTVSLTSAQALADALAKIEAYTPTTWVDNSSPDIDAEHLNKPEQAIKRVTDALNSAVDVIKDLQSQVTKNAGDISTVNNNLSNSRKTVRIPTNITTGTNILKLDPGFYAHEDNKASNQDKLNMGFPVAAWHSHIHVFGSWANAEKTNGYLTFIVEDMGDKTAGKIYYRALSWESWSPWKVISMTDFSSAT
jgi:hypothetical protein